MTDRTGSFPFFNIARDFGVPYPLVLKTVETLEASGFVYATPGASLLIQAVRAAIESERRRRYAVRAEGARS